MVDPSELKSVVNVDSSKEGIDRSEAAAIQSEQVLPESNGASLLHLQDRLRAVEEEVCRTQLELAFYRHRNHESQSMGIEESKRLRAMERSLQSRDLDILDARIEARRECLRAINARIELLELKTKLTTSQPALMMMKTKPSMSEATLPLVPCRSSPLTCDLPNEESTQHDEDGEWRPPSDSPPFINDEILIVSEEGSKDDPSFNHAAESSLAMPETVCNLSTTSPCDDILGFNNGASPTPLASPGIPAQPDFASHFESPIQCENQAPSSLDSAKGPGVTSSEHISSANDSTPMSTTSDGEASSDSSVKKPKEQLIHGYLRFIPLEAPRLKPSPVEDDYSPVDKKKRIVAQQRNVKKRLFPNNQGIKEAEGNKTRVAKRMKQSSKAISPEPSIASAKKASVRSMEKRNNALLHGRSPPTEDTLKIATIVKKTNSREAGKVKRLMSKKERMGFKKFSASSMDKVKKENPKLRKAEVNELLRQMWEGMTEYEREKYFADDAKTNEDCPSVGNKENIETALAKKNSLTSAKPKEDAITTHTGRAKEGAPSFIASKSVTQTNAGRASPDSFLPLERRRSTALNSTCSSVR